MKRILFFLSAFVGLSLAASCIEIDNFDAPSAQIHGRLIDKTTGENLLVDNGETHIRIWERSFGDNPNPQNLPVKLDGTYKNTRLFDGTYDMLPYDGAFWPCDTTYGVTINKSDPEVNFEVVPYLHLVDFKYEIIGTYIEMSCKLQAPRVEGMPDVIEIRPFVNNLHFVGGTNMMGYYYVDKYTITLNKPWSELGDSEGNGYETYTFLLPLKAGYHYWIRMGAQVRNTFRNWNYTEIIEVEIPED